VTAYKNSSRAACWCLLGLSAAAFLASSGCGGRGGRGERSFPLYPVKGRVVQTDGKPLTGGQIRFLPIAHPSFVPSGEIAADGTFTLTTELPGKGAAPGAPDVEYSVSIKPLEPIPGHPSITAPGTYKVTSGDNDLTIKVPSLQLFETPAKQPPPPPKLRDR